MPVTQICPISRIAKSKLNLASGLEEIQGQNPRLITNHAGKLIDTLKYTEGDEMNGNN
jgi:hypothetical protein